VALGLDLQAVGAGADAGEVVGVGPLDLVAVHRGERLGALAVGVLTLDAEAAVAVVGELDEAGAVTRGDVDVAVALALVGLVPVGGLALDADHVLARVLGGARGGGVVVGRLVGVVVGRLVRVIVGRLVRVIVRRVLLRGLRRRLVTAGGVVVIVTGEEEE